MTKRTHPVIPNQRLSQLQAIERIAGLWKDEDHPELNQGAAKWVAKQRGLDERRVKKIAP